MFDSSQVRRPQNVDTQGYVSTANMPLTRCIHVSNVSKGDPEICRAIKRSGEAEAYDTPTSEFCQISGLALDTLDTWIQTVFALVTARSRACRAWIQRGYKGSRRGYDPSSDPP